jgi:hypothetical protein
MGRVGQIGLETGVTRQKIRARALPSAFQLFTNPILAFVSALSMEFSNFLCGSPRPPVNPLTSGSAVWFPSQRSYESHRIFRR